MQTPTRSLYLVCYDIADSARLYRVHRFLLGYKVGGQKSFYECWLTKAELEVVQTTLRSLIDPTQDKVHLFQLDPRQTIYCLGKGQSTKPDAFFVM